MKLWQGLAMVTLLWAALYLPFLGANELRGEEARRVLPARTMLQTGDWVVPRIGGEEYSSKPPLINWMIAASFALTGVENEWTARLPSVLWLLAFALIATALLSERFGVWRGASAALFFLSAVGLLDKGRMAEIEAMYAAQTGIAFVMWAVWWAEGKPWRAYLFPAVFLGLGMLAKGPLHLLFFYGAVIPALWVAGRRRELVQAPHLLALVLIALVFLPWVVLNLSRVSVAGATSDAWVGQVAVRFSYGRIDWGEWAMLPLQMFKDFLPWSVFLALFWRWPDSSARSISESGGDCQESRADAAGMERWRCVVKGGKLAVLGGWILLSLSPEFRPRYAMPLFGIAAVLLADLWGGMARLESLAAGIDRWWRRANRAGLLVLGLGGVALALLAAWGGVKGIHWWQAWPGLLLALAVGLCWRAVERWPPLVTACLLLAGAQILVFQFAGPWKDERGLCRPVAREIHNLIPDDGRTVAFYRPGFLRFLFYLQRPYAETTTLAGSVSETAGYLAVRDSDLDEEPVRGFLKRRAAVELARREIEGRRFVFFELSRRV